MMKSTVPWLALILLTLLLVSRADMAVRELAVEEQSVLWGGAGLRCHECRCAENPNKPPCPMHIDHCSQYSDNSGVPSNKWNCENIGECRQCSESNDNFYRDCWRNPNYRGADCCPHYADWPCGEFEVRSSCSYNDVTLECTCGETFQPTGTSCPTRNCRQEIGDVDC